MSEEQRPVRQVFKKFEVLTADTAEQIGLSITAMLSVGAGWQLYGPTMCVQKAENHIVFYQSIMRYEYVTDPEPAPVEAPQAEPEAPALAAAEVPVEEEAHV